MHSVEEALAGAEQNGSDVEHKLVDHARRERLPHGGGATSDVDAEAAGRRVRALEGDIEAFGGAPTLTKGGHYAVYTMVPDTAAASDATVNLVHTLRDKTIPDTTNGGVRLYQLRAQRLPRG